ncbi:P-II family nitrogen regulator [Salisediminibacterium halotolerans]|uniref:P-II family nitrogen regulator n=2 Tax=Salisediminibacterium halotolerans TaxID=517425 RepID=UPI000EB0F675|nr:P-II family nitrogen regulator [Salisediminibacterium halotolerans]RLJ72352.1 nitrogen regulatory protein P-II [Actinophytocola xinjiangensis]RPE85566.1 nitrogen regulatory protein P-II [Salisediminibacterium halotolerans]TWG33521.1 nitrogen regulatory protein P-II [Salisediminibacterium halotolerans]GEL08532.1 nitrogen regulatory protein P-II [Salisediminibacterium halotolerans]
MISQIMRDHKLLITIVKKGKAKTVCKAAKAVGVEGQTIMLGSGVGIHEKKKVFGIDALYEKELILHLVPEDLLPIAVDAITAKAKLNEPGKGVGFVIDIKKTVGMAHMDYDEEVKEDIDEMTDDVKHEGFNLILTIVNKGRAGRVIDASNRGGAEGGTVMNARGSGIHEKAKLLAIDIEPEKDVVLTLIKRSLTKDVLKAIEEDVEINKPGNGIAFVLPVEETIGLPHLVQK